MFNVRRYWHLIFIPFLFGAAHPANAEFKNGPVECATMREGLFRYVHACLSQVDGKGYFGAGGKPAWQRVSLYGNHAFLISVTAQTSVLENPLSAPRLVRATLMQGHRYQTAVKMVGRAVSVWIKELDTGRRVSPVSTFRIKDCRIACLPWKRIEE